MPIECERLQGFPDGFTAVNGMADSPRYRMLGNAVAVPVAEWIGRRIIDRSQRGGSVTVSDGA
jgi:DNA (cytosine-5)-methyltransferase 1